jgi:O-antigen/teichoic acid export membrane protein
MSASSEEPQVLVQDVDETTTLLSKQNNRLPLNEGSYNLYNLDEVFYILKNSIPIFFASFLQYAFSVASVFTLGHMVNLFVVISYSLLINFIIELLKFIHS